MIELIERDFESFFKAPFNAYGKTTPYVSPMKSDLARFLSSRTNPLFDSEDDFTYFTALENNKPIGRITAHIHNCLLYTSPSPRDRQKTRMPSSA